MLLPVNFDVMNFSGFLIDVGIDFSIPWGWGEGLGKSRFLFVVVV